VGRQYKQYRCCTGDSVPFAACWACAVVVSRGVLLWLLALQAPLLPELVGEGCVETVIVLCWPRHMLLHFRHLLASMLQASLALIQKLLGGISSSAAAAVVRARPFLLSHSSDCLSAALAAFSQLPETSVLAALAPRGSDAAAAAALAAHPGHLGGAPVYPGRQAAVAGALGAAGCRSGSSKCSSGLLDLLLSWQKAWPIRR